jgi:hypothetical protein
MQLRKSTPSKWRRQCRSSTDTSRLRTSSLRLYKERLYDKRLEDRLTERAPFGRTVSLIFPRIVRNIMPTTSPKIMGSKVRPWICGERASPGDSYRPASDYFPSSRTIQERIWEDSHICSVAPGMPSTGITIACLLTMFIFNLFPGFKCKRAHIAVTAGNLAPTICLQHPIFSTRPSAPKSERIKNGRSHQG